MNTKSHLELLLYLLWSLLELLWHGLGFIVLQESIVVFAEKMKKKTENKYRVKSRNLATTILYNLMIGTYHSGTFLGESQDCVFSLYTKPNSQPCSRGVTPFKQM
jgi:hypothetical protein